MLIMLDLKADSIKMKNNWFYLDLKDGSSEMKNYQFWGKKLLHLTRWEATDINWNEKHQTLIQPRMA